MLQEQITPNGSGLKQQSLRDTKPRCTSGWLCAAALHVKILRCASSLTQPSPPATEGAENWGSGTSDSVLPQEGTHITLFK